MMTTELLLRKPVDADVESMYIMLEKSLSPYLTVNNSSPKYLQLIIDRNIVNDYVKRDVYLCLVAEINSEIAGWLAGSSKTEVLSDHGCSLGDFYIEEIVVDSRYRRKGIGSFLCRDEGQLILKSTSRVSEYCSCLSDSHDNTVMSS